MECIIQYASHGLRIFNSQASLRKRLWLRAPLIFRVRFLYKAFERLLLLTRNALDQIGLHSIAEAKAHRSRR